MTIVKLKIIFLFCLLAQICSSQVIKNLDSIYQSILDEKEFKNELLSDSSFLCDEPLAISSMSQDTIFKLFFNGHPVIQRLLNDTADCNILHFTLKSSSSKKYILIASISQYYRPAGYSAWISYKCILKRKKEIFVIKKEKVYSGCMYVHYL